MKTTAIVFAVLVAIIAIPGVLLSAPWGNHHGLEIITERDLWDVWCQKATWTQETVSVEDAPGATPNSVNVLDGTYRPTQDHVILSKFFGSAQIQNPQTGSILCDDGTRVSAQDGHKL